MKKMLKKIAGLSMAVLMVGTMTACSGKGSASDAIAEASDPNAAKEAVFKEVAVLDPDAEWLAEVIVSGEDIIAVWTEYEDNQPDMDMGEEIMPYVEFVPEEGIVEEEIIEEEIIEEETATEDAAGEETSEEISNDVMEDYIDDDMLITPEVGYGDEEYHFTTTVNCGRMSFGATSMNTISIVLPEDDFYIKTFVEQESGNYIIITQYDEEDYSDPDNYVYNQFYYVNTYSKDGTFISRNELPVEAGDGWYGIYDIVMDADGNYIISSEYMICIINSAFQQTALIEVSENEWISSLLVTNEGVPYVYTYTEGVDESSNGFYKIDAAAGTLGEALEVPEEFWGSAQAGAGHDLYYSTDKGIYTYDFEGSVSKKILDFVDSDIDYNNFSYAVPLDETRLVALVNDPQTWDMQISFMEKVPPEEVVEKTIITMGMVYTNYDIRSKVIDFNKSSDKYRIRLIEYYQYNNESDWDAGMKVFSNDIITSNAPDIILISENMPVDSFMEKGVLLNLNPYIEADSEIKKEDMAPNILALGSKDDETYILTQSFNVATMAMKESLTPANGTLTLNDLKQLEAQNGNISAFREVTRDDIIRYAMEMNYAEFLDLETGKCEFNTPGFCELLEYAKTYPEEIIWEEMDDTYWEESQYAIRENKALLQYCQVGTFYNVAYMEQGTYGEEVAFVGFPGTQGNNGVIIPSNQMAISADCEDPAAAWEFMRQFYTYDAQKDITYGIPVNLKALDDAVERAQQRQYWIDEEGNKVEYDDYYWLGEEEIIIKPMTEERALEVKDYVLSVSELYYYDSSIIDIIIEEAAPFFAGQKTAEQAADIIQSRVQIYVNENQ